MLGEGCAIFLVEPLADIGEGRTPLAEILAIDSRVYLNDNPQPTLETLIRNTLSTASVTPDEVWAAAGSMTGPYGDHKHTHQTPPANSPSSQPSTTTASPPCTLFRLAG